jgi:hypothetical protein
MLTALGRRRRGGRVVLGALLLGAVACGARVSQVRSPDGRDGYALNCRDPEQCYREAGELCPHGYDIFDAHERVERNPFGGFSQQTSDDLVMRQTMLVACRRASRGRER